MLASITSPEEKTMTVDQLNKLMGLLSEASTVSPMHQDLPQWMQEIGDELRKRAAGNSV